MAESSNYNLGITISARSTNVDAQLKKVEQRFKKFKSVISSSTNTMTSSVDKNMKSVGKQTKKYDKLGNRLSSIGSEQNKFNKVLNTSNKSLGKENNALEKKSNVVKKGTKAVKSNNSATENWLSSRAESLAIAIRSTAVWAVATTAIYGTQKALKVISQTMTEVNAEMIALRRVMEGALTNFRELQNTAADLGVEFAANIQDIIKSMVSWGRQGRSQIEVIELTEAALLATNVAEMEAKESVDLLTAALLQFKMDASEAVEIIDRWNEVANNFAVNAQNLALSVRESGAAARSAGVALDELIGMTTALSAATAKTGNRIGRALRTIFSRMMGDAGTASEALGKVETSLNSIGISVRKSETEYRGLSDVLTDLAVRWNDLDGVMQSNIARAIGGRRRYSDVIALIENWDMALDATSTSMNSLNSAIEENETYMEGLEANWTQVQAELNNIINTISELGGEDLSKSLANIFQSFLQNVDTVIRGLAELKEILVFGGIALGIAKIGTAFTALNSSMLLTYGTFTTISGGLTALLGAINPVVAGVLALIGAIGILSKKIGEHKKMLERAKKARESFNDALKKADTLSLTEIKNNKELVDEYKDLIEQTTELKGVIESIKIGNYGHALMELGKYVIPLVATESQLAEKNVGELRDIFPELDKAIKNDDKFMEAAYRRLVDLNRAYSNSVSWINKYSTEQIESVKQGRRETKMLKNKRDRYVELNKVQNKTTEQELEMKQMQRDLMTNYPRLAVLADDFGVSLNILTNEYMDKFGSKSEGIINIIDDFEDKIIRLEESEKQLYKRHEEQAKVVANLEEEYNNLADSKEGSIEEQKLIAKIIQEREELDKLTETLKLSEELQGKLNDAIIEFGKELDNIDEDSFYAPFKKGLGVLEDLTGEVALLEIKLLDLQDNLDTELKFEAWKADILGLSPTERLENQIDVVESAQQEALDIIRSSFIKSAKVDSKELRKEIKDAITGDLGEGIYEKLKEQGIDINTLFMDWDTIEFKEINKRIEKLAKNIIEVTQAQKKELEEELSFAEMYEAILEVDESKLDEMTTEQLEIILGYYEELANMPKRHLSDIDGIEADAPPFGVKQLIEAEVYIREVEEDYISLYEVMSDISNLDTINLDLDLEGSPQQNIYAVGNSLKTLVKDLKDVGKIDVNLSPEENIKNLKETDKELENLSKELKNIDKNSEVWKEHGNWIKLLLSSLNILGGEISDNIDKMEKKQFSNKVLEYELELMSKEEKQILNINSTLDDLKTLKEDAYSNELEARIEKIIVHYKEELRVLKDIEKIKEAGIIGDIEEMYAVFEDFDMSEITGVDDAIETLDKLKSRYALLKDTLDNLQENFNFSDEQMATIFGVDEEAIKAIFTLIEEYIEKTEDSWRQVMVDAVSGFVDNLEEEMDKMDKVELYLQEFSSALFDNIDEAELRNAFNDIGSLIADSMGLSDATANAISEGIYAAAESLSTGSGAGQALFTAAGAVIGASFGMPGVGAQVGSWVGQLAAAVFGGTEGEEEMERAKEINEQIENVEERLLDFGMEVDTILASFEDNAGILQSLFGGADWDVDNLEEAEINLEELETILERVEDTASTIFNSLPGLLSEGLSYSDFKSSFEDTVGQALQDALIDKLLKTHAIKQKIDLIVGQFEAAMEDGLTQDEIDSIQDEIDETTENLLGLEEYLDQFDFGIDGGNPDVTMDRSFRAGSTSSITYHNTFAVNSQIFMSDESAAKEAAKKLAPYIREYLNRHQ